MSKPVENPYMLWHGTNNDNTCDTLAKVALFEAACGATLYTVSSPPPVDKLKLRLSLELEELYEKAQAMGLEATFCDMLHKKSNETAYIFRSGGPYPAKDNPDRYDPVALLDACCDQRYVQDGTVLTCGLDTVFYDAFAEVQRSNMSKFPSTMEEAMATGDKYFAEGIPVVCDYGMQGKPFVVQRRSDGKILKSINYSPANLAPFVEGL